MTPLGRNDALFKKLALIVGEENVHNDGDLFADCCKDATLIERMPDLVVVVNSSEELRQVTQKANEHSVPIIARGAGTGLSGGALAEHGGIVVAIHKMDKILSIDRKSQTAIVEPGVITQALTDAAEAVGLFYPPDPASVAESTIAGNVAENAGGLRCKKYGVTSDYVLGIEGYDIYGRTIKTGFFAQNEIYDLTSLVVGSEGTLLLISKIALKLITPPRVRRTFLAAFQSQADAATVVADILNKGVIPAVLEFMDGDTVECCINYLAENDQRFVDSRSSKERVAAASLLIELDGDPESVEREVGVVAEIVNTYNPLIFKQTSDTNRREYLWTLRRSLSKAITAAAPVRVSEDVCVPPSQLPELVGKLPELAGRYNLRVNSYGHAGDGNLHVNFLADNDTAQVQSLIKKAAEELFEIVVDLNGTISGEHGIGITKREYLYIEVSSPVIDLFRKIKNCFDPSGLINPGKIFL